MLVKNLLNGAVATTLTLYYIIPFIYTMGLFLSFFMCAESTENFISSMAVVRI
jgi:hypothetical protein